MALLLLWLRLESICGAADFREVAYRFPGHPPEIFLVGSTAPYFISKTCLKSGTTFDCTAYEAFKNHGPGKTPTPHIHSRGGPVPGVARCENLHGLLFKGFNVRRSENFFCGFADGSKISLGALAEGARLK